LRITNPEMLAPDSTATREVELVALKWSLESGSAVKAFAQLERTAEARHSTSKETLANSVRGF